MRVSDDLREKKTMEVKTMSMYRNVSVSFWTDRKVLDTFTPEDKYFFIYVLTNPLTNLAGCYELSLGEAKHKTGYNEDDIYKLLARMEDYHKVLRYDKKTGEVLILNWGKYNWGTSPKVKSCVIKVANHIKNEEFKSYVLEKVEAHNWSRKSNYPKEKEVEEYVSENKYEMSSKLFYLYCTHNNWKDAEGNDITDWMGYLDRCEESGVFKKVV